MNEPVPESLIEAARAYESLMVPALFREWSLRVADAAKIAPGQRILDVACGTGILAREAAIRSGPSGSVAGLDPSPGMLEVARRLAPEVEWCKGSAESIPFEDASFDAVISQFGLMFFEDPTSALREFRRVLKPDGRMAVAVWGSLEENEAYFEEVLILERLAGRAAANAVRMPFMLGDRRKLEELFAHADFDSVDIVTQRCPAEFPSARVMVEADLRGWLPVCGVQLSEGQIERILVEAEEVLKPFVTAEGTIAFETSAYIVMPARA